MDCICLTFLDCAFSNVSSNGLPEMMHSHIAFICFTYSTVRFQVFPQIDYPERDSSIRAGIVTFVCIYFTFLHCAFSKVSSNRLPESMQSHIGCICLSFLHCAFSNVSLNLLLQMMHSYICCICSAFFHHVFSNVSSNHLQEKKHIHIGYICLISIVSRCGHLLAKYSKQHLEPIEGHEGRVD